jgi:gamma-glutamyl-gamma-aminobutyrate hydrolase PuuD
MRKVLVSQRVDIYPDRNERRDALDQQLIRFLITCDLLPVPVPNGFFNNETSIDSDTALFHKWIYQISAYGIILSGGNDIGSCNERDMTEWSLMDFAISQNMPVLGICRGMQMMGHYSGTNLKTVENHVRIRHQLTGEIAHEVNSFHNLALEDCPPDYKVSAISEDGIIEAIRHRSRKWEGWMWHPERELEFNQHDIKRIKELFNE